MNEKSLNEVVKEIVENPGMSVATKRRVLVETVGLTRVEALWLTRGLSVPRTPRTPREVLKYTFGVEIECFVAHDSVAGRLVSNNVRYAYEGYNHHDSHEVYRFVTDGSLSGAANPIECVSPVLEGGTKGFNSLKKVCKSLTEAGATVNRTTGLHVHIGAADMSSEHFANVFVNYAYLECVIDTFMAASRRGSSNTYCKSIIGKVENCHTREDVFRAYTGYTNPPSHKWRSASRYHKVNCMSYLGHKTIEFRQHGGTVNYTKIKNWVEFLSRLVAWSKDNRLTAPVESIDDIKFLTPTQKTYFKGRASEFAGL